MDEALRVAADVVVTGNPSYLVAHPAGSPATGSPAGLSSRELEVLRLVVAGRTDRAIADELFISRRTASKHVAAILAKLDVSTRAEAAVRAVRDGLV
jgi:DNA-binding NarL/FixJ family response regulator